MTGLIRGLGRGGMLATLGAIYQSLSGEVLALCRFDSAELAQKMPGVHMHHGRVGLRRRRAGLTTLPDEFDQDEWRGFQDGLVVTAEGKMAGVIWVLAGRNPSGYIPLEDGQVKLSDLYVLLSLRGRGLAKALYWNVARAYCQSGARHIFAVMAENDLPSKTAAEAVGFRWRPSIRRPALWGPRFSTRRLGPDPAPFKDRH